MVDKSDIIGLPTSVCQLMLLMLSWLRVQIC